ncbi:MAG: hypothetical protein CMF48_00545 [Legionellales bacterium]|nr:hypothetical protein [Legionellales bacterium]|tara:strand:+ start:1394 stop:1867 length:474 start_codon:yes stop_codon:yes gene_type:complete
MKIAHKQAGATLLEMVIAIVITSIALTGILSTINSLNRSSVDPVLQVQAIMFAEAMFEEIETFSMGNDETITWEQIQKKSPKNQLFKTMKERGFSMEISVLNNQTQFPEVTTPVRRIVVTCRHPAFDEDAPIVLTSYRIDVNAPRAAGDLEVPFNAL